MKCQIQVTGQINGNVTLVNRLDCVSYTQTRFNGYLLNYDTVADARRALKRCKRILKQEGDSVRFTDDCLWYDASKAELIK